MKSIKLFLSGIAMQLFLFSSHAQQVESYTGAITDNPELGTFNLFRSDSTLLYVFRVGEESRGKKYSLEAYSRDSMQRQLLIQIPLPNVDSVKFHIENLFFHDDYYQVFYSWFDKKNKMEKLQMITFNKSGVQTGETKLIDVSEGKTERKAGYFSVFNRKSSNEFLSYGSKHLKDTSYINIDHYSYEGNKLHTQNFKISEDDGYFAYSTIDSSGSLYYIMTDKLMKSKKASWGLRVYTPESESAYIYSLSEPFSKGFIVSARFHSFTDDKENINFISTYSKTASSKYSIGLYWVQFNQKSHSLVKEILVPFKTENNNFKENDNLLEMSSCIITDIQSLPEGKTRIIFESRLATTTTFYGASLGTTYEIGDIVTITIDSTFQTTGMCIIPKKQIVENENVKYTGNLVLHKGDETFFVYNELPENLDIMNVKKIKKVRNAKLDETVIMVTATNDTTIINRKILNEKKPGDEIDALLIYESLSTRNDELYTLRKRNSTNYFTRFFIKE